MREESLSGAGSEGVLGRGDPPMGEAPFSPANFRGGIKGGKEESGARKRRDRQEKEASHFHEKVGGPPPAGLGREKKDRWRTRGGKEERKKA